MGIKTGCACLLLGLVGCASRQPVPPAAASPPATLSDLQREVHQLEADASHTCEQMCVSAVISQCVLLAVEPYEFVSEECVGDRSRACLLDCAP